MPWCIGKKEIAASGPKGCKSGFVIPCHAASKAVASSQILLYVSNVLPRKSMFLDTLLVQGLLAYKIVFGL